MARQQVAGSVICMLSTVFLIQPRMRIRAGHRHTSTSTRLPLRSLLDHIRPRQQQAHNFAHLPQHPIRHHPPRLPPYLIKHRERPTLYPSRTWTLM